MLRGVFRKNLYLSLSSLVFVLLVVLGIAHSAGAQDSRSFVWNQYDVTIQVEEGGSLLITERFEAAFSGTPAFTYGYADIPTDRMEDIDLISIVAETEDGPVTLQEAVAGEYSRNTPWQYYTYGGGSSPFHIEYSFAPANNETRTFALTYRANGALRYYPDEDPPNQQVWWNAIGNEVTDLATVRNAIRHDRAAAGGAARSGGAWRRHPRPGRRAYERRRQDVELGRQRSWQRRGLRRQDAVPTDRDGGSSLLAGGGR